VIGIDVGGANLKIVDEKGVSIHYCPLFEGAPLRELLALHREHGNDTAYVVMSGELVDCFESKQEGISFIVDAVKEVFPSAVFYGTDGRFHAGAVPALAAANWLASADYLRSQYPGGIFVDFGSTTADIVPLTDFDSLLGLTDLKRLQKGYLIYTGVLRTSIPTLLHSVSLAGVKTPLSTEFFSQSADAHLVLGHIPEGLYSCDTPDKGPKTRVASLRRLARTVCADLDEIGGEGAMEIARAFWKVQGDIITEGIRAVREKTGADTVLTAGIGAPLIAPLSGGVDLSRLCGPAADALPAFAVREVAQRTPGL
jgi:probable H4MPT-linked C1 transfer pathway protein